MKYYLMLAAICMFFVSGCATAPSQEESGSTSDTPAAAQTGNPKLNTQAQGSPEEFDQNKPNGDPSQDADRVRPGYLYEVSNLNDPGLNGKYRVDFDGKIKLPYGVVLDTTGLKEQDLKSKVIEAFKPFLKSAASTHLALNQKKLWVDIRGLVNKAGRYLIDPEASIDETLNQAGSLVQNSQAEYLKIQSPSGVTVFSLTDYYNNGNLNDLPHWQGGEILFVQRKSDISISLLNSSHPNVQVFGEVKTPGELPYRRDADLLYYIIKAGGPSTLAELSKIEIVRWENGKRMSQTYDWEQVKSVSHLEAGDLVMVHAIKQTKLERLIQSFSGIATVISGIAILIIAL